MAVMADDLARIADYKRDESATTLHYKIMTGKCKILVRSCNQFIAEEPGIISDIQSINDKLEEGYKKSWRDGLARFERDRTIRTME